MPSFDEPKFNLLLKRARIELESARDTLANDKKVCKALRHLYSSVRTLDHATLFAIVVGMSGSGFSDDLAIISSSITEFFLEDLIVLAASGENPSDSADDLPIQVIAQAEEFQQEGDALENVAEDGNSAPPTLKYVQRACIIYRYL